MNNLTVIDFFCGAGGFSEGFRQMGFNIIKGYDHWKPAIDTFNHNFDTESTVKNILDFNDIKEIETLPNTDILIGSPPCVSFSSSNKSGKADKSLGLQLTEVYLKIVAVKKHQKDSILKAWFMENVANSRKYLKDKYSFNDLGLKDWARSNQINPNKIAINLKGNTELINSADYGSLQARKRVISGEIVELNKLVKPIPTHKNPNKNTSLENYQTLGGMKREFPSPFTKKNNKTYKDPQYDIHLKQENITDHFYDTGIYEVDAKFSKHWKTNHPYMGKMSFPENEEKPSRTITATRIANSRESIIYKTELNRKGNGEFRLPTVREAAILMGFPITFQFYGSEYTKWRLVGNAVCAAVSKSFAKTVLKYLNMDIPTSPIVRHEVNLKGITNLNTYKEKSFNKPPLKKKGAKCRWHPFKDGNLTVTLSNFKIGKDKKSQKKWFTSIQYGSGAGYPTEYIDDNKYTLIEKLIFNQTDGKKFLSIINNGFSEKIGSGKQLQELFEVQKEKDRKKDPTELVEELKGIIRALDISDKNISTEKLSVFCHKEEVPLKQLYALYGINKIVSIANNK